MFLLSILLGLLTFALVAISVLLWSFQIELLERIEEIEREIGIGEVFYRD